MERCSGGVGGGNKERKKEVKEKIIDLCLKELNTTLRLNTIFYLKVCLNDVSTLICAWFMMCVFCFCRKTPTSRAGSNTSCRSLSSRCKVRLTNDKVDILDEQETQSSASNSCKDEGNNAKVPQKCLSPKEIVR